MLRKSEHCRVCDRRGGKLFQAEVGQRALVQPERDGASTPLVHLSETLHPGFGGNNGGCNGVIVLLVCGSGFSQNLLLYRPHRRIRLRQHHGWG
jgi:hypothetical protein